MKRLVVLSMLMIGAVLNSAVFTSTTLAAESQRLMQTFRSSKDVQQRNDAFDKLLKLDTKTVKLLSKTINTALVREQAAYLRAFTKQAMRVGKQRTKSIPAAEVRAIRAEVLAFSNLGDQLTTEILKQKGLPALDKLRSHLMITPNAVVESSAKLKAQRERLITLGEQRRKCKTALDAFATEVKPDTSIPIEKQLSEAEAIATIQAMPISPASKSTFAANRKRATQLDPQSVAAMRQCNLTRALLGLNVLSMDTRLIKAAIMHSADMEKHKFFDHMSPVPGRKSPIDRARIAGTTASGENIFMSDKPLPGAEVSDAWFTSPPHHRGMLGPHLRIGVGRHNGHYTEMFGR